MNHNDKIILGLSLPVLGLLIYGFSPNRAHLMIADLLKLSGQVIRRRVSQRSFGSKPPLYHIILNLLQSNFIAYFDCEYSLLEPFDVFHH